MARIGWNIGGNQPGIEGTTTDGHSVEIDGTAYVKIPVKRSDGKVFYLLACEDWDFAAKAGAQG